MTLKQSAETWLKSIVGNHLGSNIRQYRWTHYLGEVHYNMLGGITYLQPCEGKVVDANNNSHW